MRDKILPHQQFGWQILFECAGLTDEDIKLIMDKDPSPKGDRARCAVIKIYTYQTDLYTSANNANCTRDSSKIMTLGPFICLLSKCLGINSGESKLVQKIKTIEAIPRPELDDTMYKGVNMLKLYRGLSLPPDAIKYYEERQKDQGMFTFNGFTSTSTDKSVAVDFAFKYLKKGNVPVIFEMYLEPNGYNKKYLDSDDLSAFPEEKEVLLGK